MKVHPDKLHNFERAKVQNQHSLQTLFEFFQTVKNPVRFNAASASVCSRSALHHSAFAIFAAIASHCVLLLVEQDPNTPWPEKQQIKLKFYVQKTHSSGGAELIGGQMLEVIELCLNPNGGICKDRIEKDLKPFFKRIGITDTFQWDKTYWPIKDVNPNMHE